MMWPKQPRHNVEIYESIADIWMCLLFLDKQSRQMKGHILHRFIQKCWKDIAAETKAQAIAQLAAFCCRDTSIRLSAKIAARIPGLALHNAAVDGQAYCIRVASSSGLQLPRTSATL